MQSKDPDETIKEIFKRNKICLHEKDLRKPVEECKQIGQFCLMAKEYKASESKLGGWYCLWRDEVFNDQEFDLIKFGKNDVLVNIEIKRQMPKVRENVLTQGKSHYRFLKASLLRYLKKEDKQKSIIDEHLYVYEIILDEGSCYRICNGDCHLIAEDFDKMIGNLPDTLDNRKNELNRILGRENLPRSFTQDWECYRKGLYELSDRQGKIKEKIKQYSSKNKSGLYSITGDAGTGKSLLLFDLAKDLSQKNEKVALFCKNGDNLRRVNGHLKTFSFFGLQQLNDIVQNFMEMQEGYSPLWPIMHWPYMDVNIDSPDDIVHECRQAPTIIKMAEFDTLLTKKSNSNLPLREQYFKRFLPLIRDSSLNTLVDEYLQFTLQDYDFILVDEAQCLSPSIYQTLIQMGKTEKFIIFCYDPHQRIMLDQKCSMTNIEPDHQFSLKDEIRQKIDIASFCKNVADGRSINMDHHKDVEIKKIRNYQEKEEVIKEYTARGYQYLCYPSLLKTNQNGFKLENKPGHISGVEASSQITAIDALGDDYDKVIIDIDWILENCQYEALNRDGCLYINMTRSKVALCLVTSNVKLLNDKFHIFPPLEG